MGQKIAEYLGPCTSSIAGTLSIAKIRPSRWIGWPSDLDFHLDRIPEDSLASADRVGTVDRIQNTRRPDQNA
jgi:hypothetical protein